MVLLAQLGSSLTANQGVAGLSPGPATYFLGDLSWNNFYGHCCQIQEGMSVSDESMCTQYWLTGLERLSLPKNSMVRLTDGHYMTEILLLRRKTPTQTNKQVLKVRNDCKNMNACESLWIYCTTIIFLSFRTDRSGQTMQTQIRLLLEEQSDLGLHCLPFRLHRLDSLLYGRATYFKF